MKEDAPLDDLLARSRQGDSAATGALLHHYHGRLVRMVRVRLDRRIAPRVSPEDVLQEAFLEASTRIAEFHAQAAVSFYVWLRFLVVQRLLMAQRAHLGTKARGVRQETPLQELRPAAASGSMAGELAGHFSSPSNAAIRRELEDQLQAALDGMDPLDREVLALRHFEEVSNQEVADILQITKDAASKRYVRALKKLREVMTTGD